MDAIKHCFKPEVHHWVKFNKNYIVHFAGDKMPVVIRPEGKIPPAPRKEPLVSEPESDETSPAPKAWHKQ